MPVSVSVVRVTVAAVVVGVVLFPEHAVAANTRTTTHIRIIVMG
jgi:hypothetical protein